MKQITKAQAHAIIDKADWINCKSGDITELIVKVSGIEQEQGIDNTFELTKKTMDYLSKRDKST